MNTLFGLTLAPLFFAIATVESDRGATSDNVYQIRRIYVDDVNRIGPTRWSYDAVKDAGCSESMMTQYWTFYGERYRKLTGKTPTYEVLARIHNGGPDGWKKRSTLMYWARVQAVLEGGAK